MKTGRPYIHVEKLDHQDNSEFNVYVAILLEPGFKAVCIEKDPYDCHDGIAFHHLPLEEDDSMEGCNLFHLKLHVKGKDPDIKHIRIEAELPHDRVGHSHHLGGSGSFEP